MAVAKAAAVMAEVARAPEAVASAAVVTVV